MSDNLIPSIYKIVSCVEGNRAVGVDHTRPAFTPVRIDMPVHEWTLHKDGDTILLGIGGYQYTTVTDKKVIASVYPEEQQKWHVTYAKPGTFIITLAGDHSKGWTVPTEAPHGATIEISPILEAFPGIYFDNQLFKFVRLDE